MNTQVENPQSSLPPIVLLLEDDADTRELYQTALQFAGLWVAQTADPADALEYAGELRPDTVLMELAIPRLADGVDLARALRANPRTAETPLVAVTNLQPHTVRAAAPLFTTIFYEPIRLEHMVRRVRWLSARAAVLSERSARAQARGPALTSKAHELVDRARELRRQRQEISLELQAQITPVPTVRNCPRCRKPLRFTERRVLEGTTFDYYLPCRNGCGLFCYDHSRRTLITLVGG
jgi:DNA-binding response OmpR family regulator